MARVTFLAELAIVALGVSTGDAHAAAQTDTLPPFLSLFRERNEPRIVVEQAAWPTAWGMQDGLWVHRELQPGQRLPALVLLPGEPEKTAQVRRCADEFAQIGYGVLVVSLNDDARRNRESIEQRTLSELGAAVFWLRQREDVLPARVGAVGWSRGADWALKLAAAAGLPACVACDPALIDLPAISALPSTAMLLVQTGKPANARDGGQTAGFSAMNLRFSDAEPGFLFPDEPAYRFHDAEQAWFQIYEFVDEHLQHADAPHEDEHHPHDEVAAPDATLAELMRSLNGPLGVRGSIAEALRDSPDQARWRQVRAQAALLLEGSRWMAARKPPRGPLHPWQTHWQGYREAAQELIRSADAQNLPAARAGLTRLTATCAACHLDHR